MDSWTASMRTTTIEQNYQHRQFDSGFYRRLYRCAPLTSLAVPFQQRKAVQMRHDGFSEESSRDDIIVRVRRWPDGQREVVGYPVRRHYQNPFEGKFDINIPKPKAKRGESEDKEKSLKSAAQRSSRRVRELAKTGKLDHMMTLTYRGVMDDRDRAARDWKAFIRRVRKDVRLVKDGDPFHFVAVLEFHESGGIHIHAGVHGYRDADCLREHWYAVVGKGEGNVDMQGPNSKGRKRIKGVHKLASYLSKYITKGKTHKLNERRYWASKGIDVPERETVGQFRAGDDQASFDEALNATMRWLVADNANWQGMMTYVSRGRKCFWFAMAATGHEEPVELDDDDDSVFLGAVEEAGHIEIHA